MTGSVIVIGAGPGIGAAVARRFAREKCPVALLARRQGPLKVIRQSISRDVPVATVEADCSDEASLRHGLDVAVLEVGPPAAVVYNAAVIRADEIRGITLNDLLDTWSTNVGGAVVAAAHLFPSMADRGGGTYLISGGMPEPKPSYLTLSLGKFGIRTLVAMLDAQYSSQGIHVASITIGGAVAPGGRFDPDTIAEHYWSLHAQLPESWDSEMIV